jgi:hypothetical protein
MKQLQSELVSLSEPEKTAKLTSGVPGPSCMETKLSQKYSYTEDIGDLNLFVMQVTSNKEKLGLCV